MLYSFTLEVPTKYDKDEEGKVLISYPSWTPELRSRIQPFIRQTLDEKPPTWHKLVGDPFKVLQACIGTDISVKIDSGEAVGFTAFEAVLHKLDEIATKVSGPVVPLNNRVNVAVPGLGLLTMTEVDVIQDCCTVELQKHLDEGWRILAICPQPDQRRPDYILGRAKPME